MREIATIILEPISNLNLYLRRMSQIRSDESLLYAKEFSSIGTAMVVCGLCLYFPFYLYQLVEVAFNFTPECSQTKLEKLFSDSSEILYGLSLVFGAYVVKAAFLPILGKKDYFVKVPHFILYLNTAYLVIPTWLYYFSLMLGSILKFCMRSYPTQMPIWGFFIFANLFFYIGICGWIFLSTIKACKAFSRLIALKGSVLERYYAYFVFILYFFIPFGMGYLFTQLGIIGRS